MFSVIVKLERFTKHNQSQSALRIFLLGEVIAAVQLSASRRSASRERRAEACFV
jgi:hypothetical protein